jgi:hypothetical protein
MKWKMIAFVFIISIVSTNAQLTYNLRLNFDHPSSTVLTSIEVTDSCFYVCGITNDTLPPYQLGSLFARISFEGEIVLEKVLVNPLKYYGTWPNTLEIEDQNFIVSGTSFDSIGMSDVLIKYTTYGDTLFTRDYRSPYLPANGFIALVNSNRAPNGGYYLVSNLTNTVNANSDMYLKKVDEQGQLEWDIIYGENQYSESGGGILVQDDKILLGGHVHNLNFAAQGYFSRALLIQLNTEGELEWEYESPANELLNFVSDIIKTEDGGYVLSSGKGVLLGPPSASFVSWQPYIFKLDADRNFEWGVDIRDSLPQTSNVINKMIEASDGSGYIVGGRGYHPNPIENGYDYLGLIAKISKEGDSLWARRYNYVQSPADEHVFYDIEESKDGGYVMVGQASDFLLSGELPRQRGWIVKVDQYGCLVPGCQLVSSTIDVQKTPFQIKLFPNPVSASSNDFLNVYFYHPDLQGQAIFQMTDASGKVLLKFSSSLGDVTHMVPVSNLASGLYWLTCQVGDAVLTEAVVVE